MGRVNDDPAAGPDPFDSDPSRQRAVETRPFPGPTVAGGVLGSIFFPVISLIAALMLMGREANPVRREALRRWAILSGGLIAAQVMLVLIAFASVASVFNNPDFDRNKECNGGPVMGASGFEDENGDVVFPCNNGGAVTLNFSETGGDGVRRRVS